MKKISKIASFLFATVAVSSMVAFGASAAKFKDVKGHWAQKPIEYGVENGYISGYPDGTFLPEKTVTRAEFSKMINNAVKITSTGNAKANYSDVVTKEWYYTEVKKAENAGYINGYEDGTFRPNNSVTRQEAAVILSRIVLPTSEREKISKFVDGSSIDSWAKDSVLMIASKGYIKGDEKGRFSPKSSLTRAQAAKLIYEFVTNENIVNGEKTIKASDEKTVVSETLFTDNVVIKSSKDAEVEFVNCRVLGTVTVSNENLTLDIEDSAINYLVVKGEGADVTADKNSSVKNTDIYYGATLSGDVFTNVNLYGDDLSSDTVYLKGNFENVYINCDATVNADSVSLLTLTKKTNFVLQSGEVGILTVESGAKGSTINLSKKTTVEKAINNAAVTYIGSGTVNVAQNNVTGVVFNGVTVKSTTGKKPDSSDNDDDNASTDSEFYDGLTVSPTKSKTNVSVSTNITIKFPDKVYNKSGKTLDGEYVEDNFEVRKSSTTGTKVAFEASVTSSKNILIKPTASLKNNTKYYVIIPKGVLKNADGEKNDADYVTYFTTVKSSSSDDDDDNDTSSDVKVTFTPDSGDKASTDTTIKITFSQKLYRTSGKKELTDEYCEDTAFEIRKGKSNGEEVAFDAEVASTGKTVTLTPSSLEADTKYYVILVGSKLYTSSGKAVSKQTSYFTTDDSFSIKVTPANKATNVSSTPEITIEFGEAVTADNGKTLTDSYVENNVVEIRTGSEKGNEVGFEAKVTGGYKTITITPTEELEAGKKYYIIINEETLIGKSSGAENEKVVSYFTVASGMSPMISPVDGKKNVSVDTSIKVSFSEKLYVANKTSIWGQSKVIDKDYISSEEVVLLRKGSASGLKVPCEIEVSSDGKTITLTPKSTLADDKEYYVVVKANTVKSASGKKNSASTTSFSTKSVLTPTFSPADGADDVKVDSKITVTFNENVYDAGGDELTKPYVVDNVLKLYPKGKESETVEFTVTSLTKKGFTIKPDDELESGTTYVLKLVAGTLTNSAETLNTGSSIEFKTESVIDKEIDFDPANNEKNVSVNVNPTITFASPIYKKGGGSIKDGYAKENIQLYEGSKSTKNLVEADVTVSDNRVFTICPVEPLKPDTKYVIYIASSKFMYEDETAVNSMTKYFTTTATMPEVEDADYSDVTENSVEISYTVNCDGKIYVEADDGNDVVKRNVSCKKGSGKLTLSDLKENTTYEVTLYVKNSDGTASDEYSFSFTTEKANDINEGEENE